MKQYFTRSGRNEARTSLEHAAGTYTASVVARSDDGHFGVRLGAGEGSTLLARATAECEPQPGDRVLVVVSDEGESFILARLGRPAVPRAASTSSGARAEVVEDGSAEKIRVRDPEGALLFEYDATSGRSSVYVPEGDLALNAPKGRIELIAADGVQCVTNGPIQMQSAVHVGMRTIGEEGKTGASVNLTGNHVGLMGHRLIAFAQRGEMRIARLRYRGQRVEATIERARILAERIETVAKRVVERLGRTDRRVEETDRRRAGRVVEEVEGMHYVTSGESTVRARGTYRLDGERINLG